MILSVDEFVARIGAAEADTLAGIGDRRERSLDTPRLTAALAFADQLIRGRLAQRIPVLPDPAPELLRGYAQDVALYRLRYKEGDTSGVGEETRRRYSVVLRELEAIAAGTMELDPDHPSGDRSVLVAPGEPARAPGILDGYR